MTRRIASLPPFRNFPPWLRAYLDSWRFWFTIGLAGIAAAIVLGYYNLERTVRDENSRVDAAYVSCVESIPLLKRLSQHVHGVNEVIGITAGGYGVYVQNSRALVAETPKSSPERATREANLRRAEAGARDVAAAREIPVPTPAQCLEQARATARRVPTAPTRGPAKTQQ